MVGTSIQDFGEGNDKMPNEDLIFGEDVFKSLLLLDSHDEFNQLVSEVTLEFEINESEAETHNDIQQNIEDISNNNFFQTPILQESMLIDQILSDFSTTSQQSNDYNEDIKLNDNTLNELFEFIQLKPVEESIKVAMPKCVNDLHHLTRNRLTPISIYYNISNYKRYLKIELISGSPALEETIKFCKLSLKTTGKNAKHPNYWFLCNDNIVEIGNFLLIDLDPQRNERCLSIKFACNTSCESMFNRTILKFSLIGDENREICQQSFNIRVSERPGRDERELIEKQHKEEIKKFNYPQDLPNFMNPHQIINKEVPKLKNFTAPNCKFEISLGNDNRKHEENKFSESIERLVKFNITEAIVENPFSTLFVRAMIVDPKHPENRIACSKNHGTSGPLQKHILRSNHAEATYQDTENGFYADERFSVRTPCQSSLSYSFMCNNLCWIERDRPYAGLIFILEDENGQMFARRYFKFSIVDRPNRTNLCYDSECEGAATKRKSNGETSTAPKRRSN